MGQDENDENDEMGCRSKMIKVESDWRLETGDWRLDPGSAFERPDLWA